MVNFLFGFLLVLLILILLFVGIVLFTRHRPTATAITITPDRKKFLINVAWLLGAYSLLLWAFAFIWPELWVAWKGQGFWLSQLLFLSAIGFLASVWMRSKKLRLIAIPLIIVAIIVARHTIKSNLTDGIVNQNSSTMTNKDETMVDLTMLSNNPYVHYSFTGSAFKHNPFRLDDGNYYVFLDGQTEKDAIFMNDGIAHNAPGDNITGFTVFTRYGCAYTARLHLFKPHN